VQSPIRVVLWFVLGALSGAAASIGDPLVLLVAVLLFAAAVVATVSRLSQEAVPGYLIGCGLAGLVVIAILSPHGAFSIDTSGRSPVCSSAGGCVGQTVTHSVVAVPALGVFAAILVIGLVWIFWQTRRSRSAPSRTKQRSG
jgi:Kef-type K+ transport system membrane component KefB